ncbi:MAG: GNAT family N-acetyltransferase [Clostridiaceae bacterium]|nr:GNAT family N-acetyltransferase [Clostridiaceae bacterium]
MTPYLVETPRIRLRRLRPSDEGVCGTLPLSERIAAYQKHPVHDWAPYTLAVCRSGTDDAIGYVGLCPSRTPDGFFAEGTIDPRRGTTEDSAQAAAVFARFMPHRFGINVLYDGERLCDCAFRETPGGDTLYGDRVTLVCMRRDAPDVERGWVASMHFDLYAGGLRTGTCSLRLGYNETLFYGGQISYTVFPACRGHGYAASAVRAMCAYGAACGMPQLAITCVPENTASRKTAEHAGFTEEGIYPIPPTLGLYAENRTHACRYTKLLQ